MTSFGKCITGGTLHNEETHEAIESYFSGRDYVWQFWNGLGTRRTAE